MAKNMITQESQRLIQRLGSDGESDFETPGVHLDDLLCHFLEENSQKFT